RGRSVRGFNNIEAQATVLEVAPARYISPVALNRSLRRVDHSSEHIREIQARVELPVSMQPGPPNAVVLQMADVVDAAVIRMPGPRQIHARHHNDSFSLVPRSLSLRRLRCQATGRAGRQRFVHTLGLLGCDRLDWRWNSSKARTSRRTAISMPCR